MQDDNQLITPDPDRVQALTRLVAVQAAHHKTLGEPAHPEDVDPDVVARAIGLANQGRWFARGGLPAVVTTATAKGERHHNTTADSCDGARLRAAADWELARAAVLLELAAKMAANARVMYLVAEQRDDLDGLAA